MYRFWAVYKNLEREFSKLMFDIHIDDDQLGVYSNKIADLILRSAVEVEAIAKQLYFDTFSKKENDFLKCVDALAKDWKLEEKIIFISSISTYLSDSKSELKPFQKNSIGFKGKPSYFWNTSYQSLKHDKINNLKKGNIESLFSIMAVLYVLNIYQKNEVFDLYEDSKATNFQENLGSEIFSIKLMKSVGLDGSGNHNKHIGFDECVYFIKFTDSFAERITNYGKNLDKLKNEYFVKELLTLNPEILTWMTNNPNHSREEFIDLVGKDRFNELLTTSLKKAAADTTFDQDINGKYEAVLNKNQI